MAGIVSFKVHMTAEDDECKKEVRRFGIEADVVTNYVYLREKIQTIFPTLRGRHFSICWKDSDNDDVLISSDEELHIALTETASDNIRKLYVTLHSEYQSAKNATPLAANEAGEIHTGVVCDGCDKQIKGFRYKCIQCADYDLCFECESKGMHSEHCLIRFTTPLHINSRYGRRLATVANKFVRNVHSQAEKMSKHCPYSARSSRGEPHTPKAPTMTLSEMLGGYLDDWLNYPVTCPMKDNAKEAKEETKAPPPAEAKTPEQQQKQQAPKCPADLLTALFSALNPDEQAASTSATKNPEKTPPTGNKTPPNAEKCSTENEGWTLLNTTDGANSGTNSPVSTSGGAIPKVQPSAPAEQASSSIYPILPAAPPKTVELVKVQLEKVQPVFYHSNPTIQKSVERMVQMGFSNDGGWLTNLLLTKGGDISAALDALGPVRPGR